MSWQKNLWKCEPNIIVHSFVRSKDVILGPKANILERHVGKHKETFCTWARNKENGMSTRNAIMQRMKLFILTKTTSQLLNKFKEGLRGSGVRSGNSLLQFYTYYNKANPCLRLRLWSFSFLYWMSPYC